MADSKSKGRKSRDELKSAAAILARSVLMCPGLTREMYMQAVEVDRLTSATQGRKPTLSTEDQWALCEFIEARMAEGVSLAESARRASDDRRFAVGARTAEEIFKAWPGPARKK